MGDYPVTVKDLIEMLEKWEPEKEFEVSVLNSPAPGEPQPIMLNQGMNSIRLN